MEDFKNRTVIRFKYQGGSNPGGYRLVEVVEANSDYVNGLDLEVGRNPKEAYRQYLKSKIEHTSIIALPNELVVLPHEVGLVNYSSTNMGTLASVYRALNPKAVVGMNLAAGVLVVKRDDIPRIDIKFKATEIVVHLVNANGEGLHFTLDHELPFKEEYSVGATLTPEQVDAFVKAVNGLTVPKPSFTGDMNKSFSSNKPAYKDWNAMLFGNKS